MQEFPDIFERAETLDRKERVAAAVLRNEQVARAQAEADALRKVQADALSRRANASVLRHEFESQGLRAPFTNSEGAPTVSLALLLQIGWTVDRSTGQAILLRPLAMPAPRRTREEYADGNT